MRRTPVVLVILAWPVLAAAEASITTHDVAIRGFAFDPATKTVASGDSVRWTNRDQALHTVTFSGGPRHDVVPTGTYTQTFTTPGSYAYQCDIHTSMKGTVVVQSANASPTSSISSTTSTTLRRSVSSSSTTTTAGPGVTVAADTSDSSTTTSVAGAGDGTTTTTDGEEDEDALAAAPASSDSDDDVDLPGGIAALLLLLTAGGALLQTRGSLR